MNLCFIFFSFCIRISIMKAIKNFIPLVIITHNMYIFLVLTKARVCIPYDEIEHIFVTLDVRRSSIKQFLVNSFDTID